MKEKHSPNIRESQEPSDAKVGFLQVPVFMYTDTYEARETNWI